MELTKRNRFFCLLCVGIIIESAKLLSIFAIMLTVITTTKDRKNVLSETMKVLLSDKVDKRKVDQFIIVNDGSEDLSEFNQEDLVTVVKNKGTGVAAGRNTGAALAKSELILFLDDDILVQPDHLNKHVELHQRFPNAIASANRFYPESLIEIAQKSPFGRYKLKYEYNWLKGSELTRLSDDSDYFLSAILAGFSCSMPRKMWEDLGGFNETFPYAGCEDNEFYVRAKKNGAKLIFDASNICYHNELDNFTLGKWIARQSRGVKGAIIMCELHPEGKSHPTYYLHEPIRKTDKPELQRMKRKKVLLSKPFVLRSVYTLIGIGEFVKLPDVLLFRMYNAVWIGETKRSFMEVYYERGHR